MITAVVREPKLPVNMNRKVALLNSGNVESHCSHCNEMVCHESADAIAVFCNDDCFDSGREDYLPKLPESILKASNKVNSKSNKPKTCPECGGPSTRGRGWAHKDGCKNSSAAILAAKAAEKREARTNCPDCDGEPGKRRGWKHKETCPRIAKPVSEPCPDCGGPKRGRGFTHTEDCKQKQVVNAVNTILTPVE